MVSGECDIFQSSHPENLPEDDDAEAAHNGRANHSEIPRRLSLVAMIGE